MGTPPDPRHAHQPPAGNGLRSLQALDEALIVRAANEAVADVTPAPAEDPDPPLSRAERRGNQRPGAGRRPGRSLGGRNAAVPSKRPVGRGRDPRLPRR
jgi:hypothetical protein